MKKLKIKLLRTVNSPIALILSLLGIQSCGGFVEEYGCPHADLTISGIVTDKNDKPIRGIRVHAQCECAADTTDEQGKFHINETSIIPFNEQPLIITDIDSTENGHYASDTLILHPKYIKDTKNKSHWYDGEAIIDDVVIKLKEVEK